MNQVKTQLLSAFSYPLIWVSIGIIPCILTLLFVISAERSFNSLKDQALYLKEKKHCSQLKQKGEEQYISQLKEADRDYLENAIEGMQFLSDETQKIQALVHSETCDSVQLKRLDFLQNGENNLRFKEQNFQRLDQYQEVEAIATNSVEMNQQDLSQLLAKIENVQIGEYIANANPPDLLIRKFDLLKKPLTTNEEHFIINLELIKRECIE